MIRKMDPTQEIDTGSDGLDRDLVRMKRKTKLLIQELPYGEEETFQLLVVPRKENEIIGVADVVFCSQAMLHELIKFIEVNVHQKLRGEIAEG